MDTPPWMLVAIIVVLAAVVGAIIILSVDRHQRDDFPASARMRPPAPPPWHAPC
jgi:hypothetical protein